ncbi:TonB-dependent receptor [Komagataeibacter xylinus]|uniref:TonB-dependent receptor n=1 Tax=Komagataeibacter xylinus TaxID=28448 RepID=UPI0010322651|nr:TonB-dependent receptor [Komagataeibacter xylinus]
MKKFYFGSVLILGVAGIADGGACAQSSDSHPVVRPGPGRAQPRSQSGNAEEGVNAVKSERIHVTVSPTTRAARSIDKETRALQKVPQAASRVDAKELAAEHITALPQATRLLPTVQLNISNPRNTTINIRGLGAAGTAPTDGLEGGVGVYVDGVYRPRPGTALSDIADLDGITVMRGPTGTESGISTTAGSINLTTAAPTFKRQIYGEAGVGNYNYARWRIGFNTPLIKDKLALRVSGTGLSNSGWVTNRDGGGNLNGSTNRSVRAQLLYTPTENLSVRFIADYAHMRENCCAAGLYRVLTTKNNGAPIANNLYARAAQVGITPMAPSNAPYSVNQDSLSDADQEDMGLSAQIDWRLRGVRLTSITAYRAWNWWPHNDGDQTQADVIRNTNQKVNERQFTQELRASGKWRNIADWTVGGFYMWQEDNVPGQTLYGSQAAEWYGLGNSAAVNNALTGYATSSYGQITTNSYALFANSTWHPTSRLDVITGVRYTYETKLGNYSLTQVAPSDLDSSLLPAATRAALYNTLGVARAYSAHHDNGFVTGQFVLNYHLNDHMMVYGRYSRGAKSGGLNLANLPTGATPNVGKETEDAFEVGSKVNLLSNRLLISGALYQMNDHNYQVTQVGYYQGSLISYLGNAKAVRVRGAELDVHYNPIANLATNISVAYNDAEFTSFNNAGGPPEVNYSGQYSLTGSRVPFDPRWAISASVQYYHNLGFIGLKQWDGIAGGSYTYSTDINTTATNSSYGWVPGYGTLNLNFGIRPHNMPWELDAFINNATDVRHITQIIQSSVSTGAYYAYVTQPINFGFIVKAHY